MAGAASGPERAVEVCVPNIGRAQRRWRFVAGIIMTAGAVLLLVVLIATDAPRPIRLTLFLPLLAAAVLLLQVQEQTCIALAARGLQHLDDGLGPVGDVAALAAMQRQAGRVRRRALLLAAGVTALTLFVG